MATSDEGKKNESTSLDQKKQSLLDKFIKILKKNKAEKDSIRVDENANKYSYGGGSR